MDIVQKILLPDESAVIICIYSNSFYAMTSITKLNWRCESEWM